MRSLWELPATFLLERRSLLVCLGSFIKNLINNISQEGRRGEVPGCHVTAVPHGKLNLGKQHLEHMRGCPGSGMCWGAGEDTKGHRDRFACVTPDFLVF